MVFTLALSRIRSETALSMLEHLIKKHLHRLSPADGLRFLLRLDAIVYNLAGQKSVEYGGGLHTKHRHTCYHDFFINRIQAGETVLDIGCGNGALSYDIAERAGACVVGIDKNPQNIEKARQRFSHRNISYVTGDVLNGLPERRFATVVLSNVLEHLPQRTAFLQRVDELVRPERFLLRVPLFERDWRVPLKKELGVEWRLDATHETEYTIESFKEEITSAGLKICYQEVRWGEIWAEAATKH